MHMRQPTCIAYQENLEIFLEISVGAKTAENSFSPEKQLCSITVCI